MDGQTLKEAFNLFYGLMMAFQTIFFSIVALYAIGLILAVRHRRAKVYRLNQRTI